MANSDSILVILYRRLRWLESNLNTGHYGTGGATDGSNLPPYDQLVGAVYELRRIIDEVEKAA